MTDETSNTDVNEDDTDVDVFERSETDVPQDVSTRWTELPVSSTLTVEDADKFLCWKDAAIVAIVGERNGGKTTLVAEIYSCFLRGSFAGTLFCHSLSLSGFEQKCFQSRAASGGLYPQTSRTSAQEGLRFFHLALSSEAELRRRDLLISERAGETYREVRNTPEYAREMPELRKASYVVFIIDGERVANPRLRQEAFASVRSLLRAYLLIANLSSQTQIQLVTTKYDLLEGEAGTGARESLEIFEKSAIELVAGKFNVRVFHTAARNPAAGSELAVGLAPLLQSWLRPVPSLSFKSIPMPVLTDEFDRLMLYRGEQ